jgi:AraC-like DNA-binding protein
MNAVEMEIPKLAVMNGAVRSMESGESEAVRKIEASIAYMLRHLDTPLQVATLAARANVSPSHFFALFKRRVGCAPIDYFIRLRMQHACRLLDETEMSVKEVAATLGYDDQFYFSRLFKAVNNVSPSRYRLSRSNDREPIESPGRPLVLAREVLIPA